MNINDIADEDITWENILEAARQRSDDPIAKIFLKAGAKLTAIAAIKDKPPMKYLSRIGHSTVYEEGFDDGFSECVAEIEKILNDKS